MVTVVHDANWKSPLTVNTPFTHCRICAYCEQLAPGGADVREKSCIAVPDGTTMPLALHENCVGCRGTVGTAEFCVAPAAHEAAWISARVRGPTTPYPVVLGEPDEIMFLRACQLCTAACVTAPK